MIPVTVFKHTSGDWVANWGGHIRQVTFNPTDETTFITLGLLPGRPVRFELNQRGVILEVYDHRTDEPLQEVPFPVTHSLYRELNIGKPV